MAKRQVRRSAIDARAQSGRKRGLMTRLLNRFWRTQRVITERKTVAVVENLEPRYLLSADTLVLPPDPEESPIVIDLQDSTTQADGGSDDTTAANDDDFDALGSADTIVPTPDDAAADDSDAVLVDDSTAADLDKVDPAGPAMEDASEADASDEALVDSDNTTTTSTDSVDGAVATDSDDTDDVASTSGNADLDSETASETVVSGSTTDDTDLTDAESSEILNDPTDSADSGDPAHSDDASSTLLDPVLVDDDPAMDSEAVWALLDQVDTAASERDTISDLIDSGAVNDDELTLAWLDEQISFDLQAFAVGKDSNDATWLLTEPVQSEQQVNEVVFVDAAVEEREALIEQALRSRDGQPKARVEVVYLDRDSDGVEQISSWLRQYRDLKALHVVSHGAAATATLGTARLTNDSLDDYADDLRGWSDALADGADILFYGCAIAEGEQGKKLVRSLSNLTGADVAASKTLVGNAELGGNWELEYLTGSIEAESLVSDALIYDFVLSTPGPEDVEIDTQQKLDELTTALDNADQAIDAALKDEQLNKPIEGLGDEDNDTVNELLGLGEIDEDVSDLGETVKTTVQLEKLVDELGPKTIDSQIEGFSREDEKIVVDLDGTPDEIEKQGIFIVHGDGTGDQPTITGKDGSSAEALEFDFSDLREELINAGADDFFFINATGELVFNDGDEKITVAAANAEVARTNVKITSELFTPDPEHTNVAELVEDGTNGNDSTQNYKLRYTSEADLNDLKAAIVAHADFRASVTAGNGTESVSDLGLSDDTELLSTTWRDDATSLDISKDLDDYSDIHSRLTLGDLKESIENSSRVYEKLKDVDEAAESLSLTLTPIKGDTDIHGDHVYGLRLSMDATVNKTGIGLTLTSPGGTEDPRTLDGDAILRFDLKAGFDVQSPADSAFIKAMPNGDDDAHWVAGFIDVTDGDDTFDLTSQVVLELYDIDDLDGTGRVFDVDFDDTAPWNRTNIAELTGTMDSGDVFLNADLDDGEFKISYVKDATIGGANQSAWEAVFAQMASVGEQIDQASELGIDLPMVGVPLYDLMLPSDGRTVGDVFAFIYYRDGFERRSVLDDVFEDEGSDAKYSDLMAAIGEYLAGAGAYIDLDGLLPTDFLDSGYVIRGGEQSDGTVDFALSLNLENARNQAVSFDDRLESIGFDWQADEGLPMAAQMRANITAVDVTGSANDIAYDGMEFSAAISRENFNANGLIGAAPVLLKGEAQFESGVIEAEVAQSPNPLLNFTTTDPMVLAYASFELTGDLFGQSLSDLGGGTPSVELDWRDNDDPVLWSNLHSVPLAFTFTNLSSLSALGALSPGELLAMARDFGEYLEDLRDSGEFDGQLPFTELGIGQTFDFSRGWFDLIDQQLQSVEQAIFAAGVIAPVLTRDLAFDVQFQRPGDPRLQMVTVTLSAEDTQNFTHIDELAALIDREMAAAVNAALGYQRFEDGQWVDVDAELEVTRLTGGSDGSNPTNEQQRLRVLASEGDFKLTFDGHTTGALSPYISAARLQNILQALPNIGQGNVRVQGGGKDWTIEFRGDLAGQSQGLITAEFVNSSTRGGLIKVTSQNLDRVERGVNVGNVNGSLVFSQVDPGTFDVLRIAPTAGVAFNQVQAGSGAGTSNPTAAIQRMQVIHAAGGEVTLQFQLGTERYTTDAINLNFEHTDDSNPELDSKLSVRIAHALNEAVEDADPFEVTVSDPNAGGPIVVDGVQAFDIKVVDPDFIGQRFGSLASDSADILSRPGVQAVVQTLRDGAVAVGGDRAAKELQRLTIQNAAGGTFLMNINLNGELFVSDPIGHDASAQDIQDAILAMLQEPLPALTAGAVQVTKATVENGQNSDASDGISFDIEFDQGLTGINLPRLSVNPFDLNRAAFDRTDLNEGLWGGGGLSEDDRPAGFFSIDRLGFPLAGQDQQSIAEASFATWQDFASRIDAGLDASLADRFDDLNSHDFDVNPQFDGDIVTFDLVIGSGERLDPAAVNVDGSVGDLGGFSTDTRLDIESEVYFKTTLGFDLSNVTPVTLEGGGFPTASLVGTPSGGLANGSEISFGVEIDGKDYGTFSVATDSLTGIAEVNGNQLLLADEGNTAFTPELDDLKVTFFFSDGDNGQDNREFLSFSGSESLAIGDWADEIDGDPEGEAGSFSDAKEKLRVNQRVSFATTLVDAFVDESELKSIADLINAHNLFWIDSEEFESTEFYKQPTEGFFSGLRPYFFFDNVPEFLVLELQLDYKVSGESDETISTVLSFNDDNRVTLDSIADDISRAFAEAEDDVASIDDVLAALNEGITTGDNVESATGLSSKTTDPDDPLGRLGFDNLNDAIQFKLVDGEVVLEVNASVGQVDLTNVSPTMRSVLGITATPLSPSPDTDGLLPANGQLSSDATFQIILDNAPAIDVTVTESATSGNTKTEDLIADIQAALNAVDISSDSYLGTGGLGFNHLGEIVSARLLSRELPSLGSSSNGDPTGFLALDVTTPEIARLRFEIADQSEPGARELALAPGLEVNTRSASLTVENFTIEGQWSGEVHGQAGSAAEAVAASDIGLTEAVTADAGQSENLNAALTGNPDSGKLDHDVGIRLALEPQSNDRSPFTVTAAVFASQTAANNDVSDLVDDLNAAAQQAIAAHIAAGGEADSALENHNFFDVSGSQLQLVAPGDVEVTLTPGSVDLSANAVIGLVNIAMSDFAVEDDEYQGRFTYELADQRNGAGDPVDLGDARAALFGQSARLGASDGLSFRSAQPFPGLPENANGAIGRDIGLRLEFARGGGTDGRDPLVIMPTLRASDTTGNTSLSDLAADLNATIRAEITGDPFDDDTDSFDFITVVGDRLKFNVPEIDGNNVRVAFGDRALRNDFSENGLTFDFTDDATIAKLNLSGISVDVLEGMPQPASLDDLVLSIANLGESLRGEAVGESAVELPDFDIYEGLVQSDWGALTEALSELPGLLGNLANMGEHPLFNQSVPILDQSVNEYFGLEAELRDIVAALEAQDDVGLLEFRTAFSQAFGLAEADIDIRYDDSIADQEALFIEFERRFEVETLEQFDLLIADPRLLALLRPVERERLEQLAGSLKSLTDTGGDTPLPVTGLFDYQISLGIDLSRANDDADLGRVFLQEGDRTNETGTYGDFSLSIDLPNVLFSVVDEPGDDSDSARGITLDERDLSEGNLVFVQVGGVTEASLQVAEEDSPGDIASTIADELGDDVSANGDVITIDAAKDWGQRTIELLVFAESTERDQDSSVEGLKTEAESSRDINLVGTDLVEGRELEVLVFDDAEGTEVEHRIVVVVTDDDESTIADSLRDALRDVLDGGETDNIERLSSTVIRLGESLNLGDRKIELNVLASRVSPVQNNSGDPRTITLLEEDIQAGRILEFESPTETRRIQFSSADTPATVADRLADALNDATADNGEITVNGFGDEDLALRFYDLRGTSPLADGVGLNLSSQAGLLTVSVKDTDNQTIKTLTNQGH